LSDSRIRRTNKLAARMKLRNTPIPNINEARITMATSEENVIILVILFAWEYFADTLLFGVLVSLSDNLF